jgi:hypothetical protein
MLEHLEDLVLTIFVFFILKHFLNCDFLSSSSIDSEVDHTESTLPGHSFYFVLGCRQFGFLILSARNINFRSLIWLGLHVLVDRQRFVLVDFKVLPLRIHVLGHVFGVDIDELWL